MNFGEKLYRLRKEKGLSQEALAERLNTTRQAVSKWENNQGYPETEKLIQLAGCFQVTTDYLLRDEQAGPPPEESGYYVSRELAEGYLAASRRGTRYLGQAFACWALAGVPYALLPDHPAGRLLGVAACVALGVVCAVLAMFTEQPSHQVLTREPLLFDPACLRDLTAEYRARKRKYTALAVPATILFILGILALAYTVRQDLPWSPYHAVVFLALATGLLGFVYTLSMLEAYELLVHNDQHTQTFLFHLRRKLRSKLDP